MSTDRIERAEELLYEAWTIIANAGHIDNKPEIGWHNEHPDWQAAAARWRDAWHAHTEVAADAAAALEVPDVR